MRFGEQDLVRNDQGPMVEELQIRLAGFRGTIPDGKFGPGTELQVMEFQRNYMRVGRPSGIVDHDTFIKLDEFADGYPINFDALKCPCGECDGFGNGRFRNRYRSNCPHTEAYYRYEYPGLHRMLLWAVRALEFYYPNETFIITSGYRCHDRNLQKKRTSTNHHGKAIDLDIALMPNEDKRDDMQRCDDIRGKLVETASAQIGWDAHNRKSLEPAYIAPTWVHYDVRNYNRRKYLADRFFCRSQEQLDHKPEI